MKSSQRPADAGLLTPVQADDLYRYTFLSSLQRSPDGRQAAMVTARMDRENDSYRSDLSLVAPEGIRPMTADGKVRFYTWEDDRHLLFAAVRTEAQKKQADDGDPVTHFYRLPIDGGEAALAFSTPFSASSVKALGGGRYLFAGTVHKDAPDLYLASRETRDAWLKARKEDADYTVVDESPFWSNGAGLVNGMRTALYLADPKVSGGYLRLTPPAQDVSLYDLDEEAGIVYYAASTVDGIRQWEQRLYSVSLDSGEVRCLVPQDLAYYVLQYDQTGRRLVVAASDCRTCGVNENPHFFVLPADGASVPGEQADPAYAPLRLLARGDSSLVNEVLTDVQYGHTTNARMQDGSLYFVTTLGYRSCLCRLTPDGRSEILAQPRGSVDDFAVLGDRILMVCMDGLDMEELYEMPLPDVSDGSEYPPVTPENGTPEPRGGMLRLTNYTAEALQGRFVSAPRHMVLQRGDHEVDGWVLLPFGYEEGRRYPAVLDIHGGPKCAYGELFFHEMQLWAGKGYFVFFCNPFGGDGKGNAFMFMRDRYGTTDYEDLMAFTDEVLSRYPAIDPARVCVTGGSYGGFMTNWVVGHTDRFCCAASQRSISSWISMYGISDIGPVFTEDQCGAGISTDRDLLQIWSHSPLRYADHVKTPTLFIHSEEDYRCPLAEGIQFFTALRQRGVESRMCIFKGENHELSRSGKPKHRLRRLQEITDWFDRYSCADGSSSASVSDSAAASGSAAGSASAK